MSCDVDINKSKIKFWIILFVAFGFFLNPSYTEQISSKTVDEDNFKLLAKDDIPLGENSTLVFSEIHNFSGHNNTGFLYHKCSCNLIEFQSDNEGCKPINIESALSTLQVLHSNEQIFSPSVLSSVKIEDVTCPKSHILSVVNQDEFFLLDDGVLYNELLDITVKPDSYCFEYLDGFEGLRIIAKICIPLPDISVCSSGGSPRNALPTPMSISFGGILREVDNLRIKGRSISKCESSKQLKSLSLQDLETNLYFDYFSGKVRLIWNAPFPAVRPQVLSDENYCLVTDSQQQYSVRFCYDDPIVKHSNLCSNLPCVRKCCLERHIYDLGQRKCVLYEQDKILNYTIFRDAETSQVVPSPKNFTVEYSFPWCQPKDLYVLDPHTNPVDEFLLLKNGSLFITSSKLAMSSSQYCIDNFLSPLDNQLTIKAISCFTKPVVLESKCLKVHKIMYPILIAISCAFLFITLMVYAVIPEFRTKLHGKSLISHVSSLLMAFLCQLIVSWSSSTLSMTGCKIIGLGNQVSFLWAFFWLNVMCFDIWWTLRSMRIVPETGEDSRRRFFLYSLYAWGCPVIICFSTAVLEFLPNSVDKTGLILPGFGLRGCWFQDVLATWIYFHGFTLSLYVLNIFFFFHVATILIRGQKSTEGILRTTKKQHRERVYLYLKLFLVMGVTWICEVASWQEGTCEYWIFTDIINSLQGVMIFFIFMCNRKVFQKIHAKGVPILRQMKDLVRIPSMSDSGVSGGSNTTPRTSQTS